jgi:hypothetical protein
MRNWCATLWTIAALMGPGRYAHSAVLCDHALMISLHECERVVGSLRADKAGKPRVFAPDGSEFTAAEASWMTQELRRTAHECAEGDADDAAHRLEQVKRLLKERHRSFFS